MHGDGAVVRLRVHVATRLLPGCGHFVGHASWPVAGATTAPLREPLFLLLGSRKIKKGPVALYAVRGTALWMELNKKNTRYTVCRSPRAPSVAGRRQPTLHKYTTRVQVQVP